MANLFYPQLVSGAMAQYPLRRQNNFRTIRNVLADGRLILLPDSSARRLHWQLAYSNLSLTDVQALESHFRSCNGPLASFTFLDPAANLFTSTEDLTAAAWTGSGLIQVISGIGDPQQGNQAFRLTNQGQASLDFCQTLPIPSNYQYCLSVYARATLPASLALFQRGSSASSIRTLPIGTQWSRLILSGKLSEQTSQFTAGLTLLPGQQIDLFGPQLEAQPAASDYKATGSRSGIYTKAYWAMEEFVATVTGPDQYSALAFIESGL